MQAITRVTALSVLALSGIATANASIVTPNTAGGSEAILSIVNNTTSDSISIDLGTQVSGLALGSTFNLDAAAQSFIAAAGGTAGVSYSLIAGSTTGTTLNFLTSSTNDLTTKAIANATKGTWSNSITQLVGNLNAGDGTATSVNLTYGPFDDAIGSPNFLTGGHNLWQTGDAQLNNLALGTVQTNLYQYSLTGFSGTRTAAAILGPVQLTGTSFSVVPVPAAVWLMGSALLSLFGAARRRQVAGALASLKDRISLRVVDLM
jgi:hypothetical protein